jgi:TM2 domain-containing membrane protein YozV
MLQNYDNVICAKSGVLKLFYQSKKITAIMKKIFTTLFFLLCCLFVSAQDLQDVVYLKNGSVLRGTIIEQVPNQSLKIQLSDGSIFVYQFSEIDKIAKEPVLKSAKQSPTPLPLRYTFGNKINPIGNEKSPFLAGFLSFIIPGVGQWYNGDIGGGFFYLGCNILTNSILLEQLSEGNDVTLFFFCSLTVEICATIDAAIIAKRVNVARGFRIADNTYLKIVPTMIQSDLAKGERYDLGLSLKLNF